MGVASQIERELSGDQSEMAQIIASEFASADLPPEFAAAAIVNAWHESRLNPLAAGDGGSSIGLFQLHERGGGSGMSVGEREDPTTNTRRIIEEVESRWGNSMREAYEAGERKVSEFAAIFSRDIERPADKEGNMTRRAATALEFFPSDRVTGGMAWYWWLAIVGAVAVTGGAVYYRVKR